MLSTFGTCSDRGARCRQRAEPGSLAGDVPGPRQGKRRPVESGPRLAPGPGLKAVVPWRAGRVRVRPVLCRQRRGGCTGYEGESQAAWPSRFEACLRVWRTLAGLLRVLCRRRPWIEPTDSVHNIRDFYPEGFCNDHDESLRSQTEVVRARRSRHPKKQPTQPPTHECTFGTQNEVFYEIFTLYSRR